MRRVWGVEGGRLPGDIGDFGQNHKGIDVWAKPGASVVVPIKSEIEVVLPSFDPGLKGQARGWITIDGVRYGWVIAHLEKPPRKGRYTAGDMLGRVARRIVMNGTVRTPHVHIALNPERMPPPGTVDPAPVWRRLVGLE